jgi:uncharacterized protein YlxW (UPF0749 family)
VAPCRLRLLSLRRWQDLGLVSLPLPLLLLPQAAAAQAATDRAARVTAGQHQRELVAELRKQGSEHRQEITALRKELDEVRRGKEEAGQTAQLTGLACSFRPYPLDSACF